MEQKQYFAFISYKREDEKWASWLQHKLEHYKLPSNLNGRTDLPKYIRPVFKDTSELSAGVLADEIKAALDQSKYLIVICSPNASKSKWVNKEAQSFIDSGRADRIIPFIIDGTPNSGDPETECFPLAIRELPEAKELLGVNIKEMGRDAAAVKVVAHMLGLNFDTLWQRHEKESNYRRFLWLCGILFIAIIGLCIGIYFYSQNQNLLKNQSRYIASVATKLVDEGDSYTAIKLATEVLPKNLNHPNRPYTVEAEAALRKCYQGHAAIFRGIESPVFALAFSSDGSLVASGSMDGMIQLWNVDTGKRVLELDCNDTEAASVNSIVFTLDGNGLVSSSGRIKLWDIHSGKLVKGYDEYGDYCAISPDGSLLASCGSGGHITIVSIESGEIWKELPEQVFWGDFYAEVYALKFSPDGGKIASGFEDGTIHIWDINTEQKVSILKHSNIKQEQNRVLSLDFSPDGKSIISGTEDGSIHIWDLESLTEINKTEGLFGAVGAVMFLPDGKSFISGTDDGTVRLWDSITCRELALLTKHDSRVLTAVISPQGDRIVSSNLDRTIRLDDIEKDVDYRIINEHSDVVRCLAAHPQTQMVASGSQGQILIANYCTGETTCVLSESRDSASSEIWCIDFSPDGKTLVSGDANGICHFWNVESGEQLLETDFYYRNALAPPAASRVSMYSNNTIYDLSYSSDGKRILLCTADKAIRLIDATSGEEIDVIDCPNTALCVSFTPDETGVISGMADGNLLLWDIETKSIVKEYFGHSSYVLDVTFNHNGKLIASCSKDGTVRLWETQSGRSIHIFTGQSVGKNSVAFSPNDERIVSGSEDGSICIWDTESGMVVKELDGHKGAVGPIVYLPSGEQIISGSSDMSVRLWEIPSLQKIIDSSIERFYNNPFTNDELKMYYLK